MQGCRPPPHQPICGNHARFHASCIRIKQRGREECELTHLWTENPTPRDGLTQPRKFLMVTPKKARCFFFLKSTPLQIQSADKKALHLDFIWTIPLGDSVPWSQAQLLVPAIPHLFLQMKCFSLPLEPAVFDGFGGGQVQLGSQREFQPALAYRPGGCLT